MRQMHLPEQLLSAGGGGSQRAQAVLLHSVNYSLMTLRSMLSRQLIGLPSDLYHDEFNSMGISHGLTGVDSYRQCQAR